MPARSSTTTVLPSSTPRERSSSVNRVGEPPGMVCGGATSRTSPRRCRRDVPPVSAVRRPGARPRWRRRPRAQACRAAARASRCRPAGGESGFGPMVLTAFPSSISAGRRLCVPARSAANLSSWPLSLSVPNVARISISIAGCLASTQFLQRMMKTRTANGRLKGRRARNERAAR